MIAMTVAVTELGKKVNLFLPCSEPHVSLAIVKCLYYLSPDRKVRVQLIIGLPTIAMTVTVTELGKKSICCNLVVNRMCT